MTTASPSLSMGSDDASTGNGRRSEPPFPTYHTPPSLLESGAPAPLTHAAPPDSCPPGWRRGGEVNTQLSAQLVNSVSSYIQARPPISTPMLRLAYVGS